MQKEQKKKNNNNTTKQNPQKNSTNMILVVKNINKSFTDPNGGRLQILSDINIQIQHGEMIALLGRSGSGKTTLLHILGLLDKADNGELYIDGEDTKSMDDNQRSLIRAHKIGFIFQFHYLLKELSAIENVMMPAFILGHNERTAKAIANELLQKVEMDHRANHLPSELSGGERQRVAIARALMNKPKLLLADEPTGSLDPKTADKVFKLIYDLCKYDNLSVLVATHSHSLAERLDRKIKLSDTNNENKT